MSGAVMASTAAGARAGLKAAGAIDGGFNTWTGFSNGGGPDAVTMGTISPATESHGYTIDEMSDIDVGNFTYVIEGNHTGAQFTSIVINGHTFTRTSATAPNGNYDAGSNSTQWVWTSLAGLSAGTTYPFTINP